MANKDDYIRTIISHMSAVSGNDFQNVCSSILKFYYKEQGLNFEKVGAARGDFKNDGWIESKSIYFQMYSPEQFSESFINDLYTKFEEDFCGLCEHVYGNGKWSGKILKYYFIVNTRDRDIPHDENRIVSTVKTNMETKYRVTFDEIKIWNKDDLIYMLNELDNSQLESLTTILGLSGVFDVVSKTPRDYALFMNALSSAIVGRSFDGSSVCDYAKIPDQDKIRVNSLEAYSDRIVKICSHLCAVDEAVEQYLQNETDDKKLNRIIKLYIDIYKELKDMYSGVILYDKIIDTVCSYLPDDNYRITAEVFLVYIFDRCDIFERA